MDNKVTNVLFCGVGGQGVLLASDVTSAVALEYGLDVKKSEVHGMAQRGGNVDSHVRFGKKVYSPLIPAGETDYMVSFELVEPLRWLGMMRKDGTMLVSSQKIHSLFTGTGIAEYPANAREVAEGAFKSAVFVDALSIAKEIGNTKVVNTILLAMLAKRMPFEKDLWISVLSKHLKPKVVDINMKAFEKGYSL